MGLFGRNLNEPGKGVSKNEPEKKGFFRFFELYFRNFWVLVSAEFFYILMSIPIVTTGLAQVGMAYICRMVARDKHVFVVSDFFGAIKRNWKRALPLGIINLVINIIFAADMYVWYIFWTQDIINKTWGSIIFAVSMFLFAMLSFARFYQYTLMVTFDYNLKTIIKNSWLMATIGIKHNLIIGATLLLLYFGAYGLLCIDVRFGIAAITMIGFFLFPAFRMFLIQFNVFPEIKRSIIDPYYEEHPDEDIEKRYDLGLLKREDQESVFEDGADVESDGRN